MKEEYEKKNEQLNDLTWQLFAQTGQIGYFMLNKNLYGEGMQDPEL